MNVDRALQLDLLNRLANEYPQTITVGKWLGENSNSNAMLHYLSEHGLIDGSISRPVSGQQAFTSARITAAGLDFLADDGGLSAILGVVTIKLHEETIRQLLIDRIEASPASPEERSALAKAIRNLPTKALGALTDKLLKAGADHLVAEGPKLYTVLAQLVAQQFG